LRLRENNEGQQDQFHSTTPPNGDNIENGAAEKGLQMSQSAGGVNAQAPPEREKEMLQSQANAEARCIIWPGRCE
jgi:hypothetical protein